MRAFIVTLKKKKITWTSSLLKGFFWSNWCYLDDTVFVYLKWIMPKLGCFHWLFLLDSCTAIALDALVLVQIIVSVYHASAGLVDLIV